jgi:hypothetical protein
MHRVNTRDEIREFLTSRRARITPEQAGLPTYGGNRRVPGLRREEVALLAGISVEYYTRLERGNARGGLRERGGGDRPRPPARRSGARPPDRSLPHRQHEASAAPPSDRQGVRPSVQRIPDSMTVTPAFVQNGRLDILHTNQLGYALFSEIFRDPAHPANAARFVFEALNLLASWASTPDQVPAIQADEEACRSPAAVPLSGVERSGRNVELA